MSDHSEREPLSPAIVYGMVLVFAVVSVLERLYHPVYNLAPVGALCLFAGSRLRSWQAYLLPMAVMVVSDLGLYWLSGDRPFDPFVYGSYLVTILLGSQLLRKVSAERVGALTLGSSLQFYLITNFGCWLGMPGTYERSLTGLADCYVKAAPFYGPTLAGDVIFSTLFFGVYALAVYARRSPVAEEAA